MINCFLSLGSNLGDCVGNLKRAKNRLVELGVEIVEESSIYESEPVVDCPEDTSQPWFLNQVIKIETKIVPQDLLKICKKIEEELGRESKKTLEQNNFLDKDGKRRYFPREIDIDILIYGEEKINDPNLKIPHPRLKERKFVLMPLAEIDKEYAPLLRACLDSATVRLL